MPWQDAVVEVVEAALVLRNDRRFEGAVAGAQSLQIAFIVRGHNHQSVITVLPGECGQPYHRSATDRWGYGRAA